MFAYFFKPSYHHWVMERKKTVKKKKKILAGELPPDEERIKSIMLTVQKMQRVLDENIDELGYKPHLIPGAMQKLVQTAKEIRDFSQGSPETYDEIIVTIPILPDKDDAAEPDA